MLTLHSPKKAAALAALTAIAAFGLGETQAQAQLFGNGYKIKIKERGYYPRAAVVSPYTATTYVPTTYIQTAPIVASQTRVIQPAPIVQRRVIQPAPVVETRLVQPAPVIERRIIQPAPIVQSRVIQAAPVIERQTYVSSFPY